MSLNSIPPVTIYILAKNEEMNIGKCLRSVVRYQVPVIVLDSGSTDRTECITKDYPQAQFHPFVYVNHEKAYNLITGDICPPSRWAMILDADMEIEPPLWEEIVALTTKPHIDCLVAPVLMYSEGQPLHHGSLYPPKPCCFRGGQAYFQPKGHGERLVDGVRQHLTNAKLIHNDLKPFDRYLLSQVRYAANTWERSRSGDVTLLDRINLNMPIRSILLSMVSYIGRGGFLAGRPGAIYALDRLLAGLVQFRCFLAYRLNRDTD